MNSWEETTMKLRSVLAMILAVVMLAACAAGFAEGKTTVTIWSTFTKGQDEYLRKAVADFNAGTLNVFDTKNFTVGGKALDSYKADVDTDAAFEADTEVIADGYFHESEYRSAPYFDLRIDGITLLNEKF